MQNENDKKNDERPKLGLIEKFSIKKSAKLMKRIKKRGENNRINKDKEKKEMQKCLISIKSEKLILRDHDGTEFTDEMIVELNHKQTKELFEVALNGLEKIT